MTALTRADGKRGALKALGATVAVADALDREALLAAVEDAHPTHVIHQLTALPPDGPRRARDLDATNRLRIEGTRNLLEAAVNVGARRFVVGSFAPLAPRDAADDGRDHAATAVRAMEAQVLDATARGALQGVVLRYGLFYGPELPSTAAMIDLVRRRMLPVVRGDRGALPFIHLDDAVGATLLALAEGAGGGRTYEIVDDLPVSLTEMVETIAQYSGAPPPHRVPAWVPRLAAPYMARMLSMRLALSNAASKADLGWRLEYPTVRHGLAQMLQRAA